MFVYLREPVGYSEKALEIYRGLGTLELRRPGFPDEESVLAQAEILVTRLDPIQKDLLDRLPKLRVIAVPTTGLNHIDLEETERRGIKIVSLKGRRDITDKIYATSELTVALILTLLRHVPSAHRQVLEGGWDRMQFVGREVSRKTVGIIGCGRLGSRVAMILQAMGATVVATDPHQPPERIPNGVERLPLEETLRRSDIVSIHVNLDEQTQDFFAGEAFAQMKPGAYLVNTSRGEVLDETALLAALTSGRLGGAALDVMSGEHPSGSHLRANPLVEYARSHENLILVPHIGGATVESMHLTEEAIANETSKLISTL